MCVKLNQTKIISDEFIFSLHLTGKNRKGVDWTVTLCLPFRQQLFSQFSMMYMYIHSRRFIALYMYKCQILLLTNFEDFFTTVKDNHNYNTRLSYRLTYMNALPETRTNCGIFNIWYWCKGAKSWNDTSYDIKLLPPTQSVNISRKRLNQKLWQVVSAYWICNCVHVHVTTWSTLYHPTIFTKTA